MVIWGVDEERLKVLLVERALDPFKGAWALPGGYVHEDESLEQAARRELREETGVRAAHLQQLAAFGDVTRNPVERVVTVAYFALVRRLHHRVRAKTDARQAAWFPVHDLPALAFDHAQIIRAAHARLREQVRHRPIGIDLLPLQFTLGELQHVYETILGRSLDRGNFRRAIISWGLLERLGKSRKGVPHRAARLYRFRPERYRKLEKQGYDFDI